MLIAHEYFMKRELDGLLFPYKVVKTSVFSPLSSKFQESLK